jgi:hypothetical protein
MEPEPTDEPLEHEQDLWEPGQNEMKRCCLKRHGKYHVNMLFMNWSVSRRTIKEIWRVKWHRNWDMSAPLPNPSWNYDDPSLPDGQWPTWMVDIPEPAF